MAALFYRPGDDALVLKSDDDVELGAVNAADMAARRVKDPKMAAMGLSRFISFADWQVQIAGTAVWRGSVEEAVERAPRLR